jgi:hypothetical protein
MAAARRRREGRSPDSVIWIKASIVVRSIPQPSRPITQHQDYRVPFRRFLAPGALPALLAQCVKQFESPLFVVEQLEP